MSLDALQDVMKCFGIRPVLLFDETQPQGLAGLLEKIRQLLNFEHRQFVAGNKVLAEDPEESGSPASHVRLLSRNLHLAVSGSAGRLIDQDLDVFQGAEFSLDQFPNALPIQAAVATSERWHGDALDPVRLDYMDECVEPALDILDF